MVKEFKDFLLRGNVVDLAVGIVIGVAFGAVVTSFVDNIVNPLLGLITGGADFSSRVLTIGDDTIITYGAFINALIAFVAVAAAIFFFVVKPVNKLTSMRKQEPSDPTTKDCPECLSTIPVAAGKCAFCGSAQAV